MARDRRLARRDAFVIPGGLLVAYGLIGLAFVLFVRKSSYCDESTRILLAGACYSLIPLGVLPILVGGALLAIGLVRFRGRPEELEGYLHHGSGLHFTLALLASLVVVPLIAAASIRFLEQERGETYSIRLGGVVWQESFLFEVASLAMLLVLVPLAILAARHVAMRRRFLEEAERVAAGMERPAASPADAGRPDSQEALPPDEQVDEALWPASRAAERALAAAAPRGAAAPTMAAAAAAASAAAAPTPALAAAPAAPAAAAAASPAPAALPASAEPASAVPPLPRTACPALLPTGRRCARPPGASGRYCDSHGCQALTASGTPCWNAAAGGSRHCLLHGG